MKLLLILLILWVGINVWATRRVLRSDLWSNRKTLLIISIWVTPLLGALMAPLYLPSRDEAAEDANSAALPPGFLDQPPATEICQPALPVFDVPSHMHQAAGFPLLDWEAFHQWAAAIRDSRSRRDAYNDGTRAWLLHLKETLGPYFNLFESEEAFVLSSLEPKVAVATANYLGKTRNRINRVLSGIANFPEEQKSVLLILDDEEWYYHYVAIYYPEEGEFAVSGGMFIDAGCPHFVARRADLAAIEPVIAHEMTHSALSHLELPLWLDEGIAVNTERVLAGAAPSLYTPQELRDQHQAFWNGETIQEFWSGRSFHRPDEGNRLSYDLARILVEHLGRDWARFALFISHAKREDAGAGAAMEHLPVDLGTLVCALLENQEMEDWSPKLAETKTAAA